MCVPLLASSLAEQDRSSLPGAKDAAKQDTLMTKDTMGLARVPAAGANFYGKRLIFFGAAENKKEPALLQLFSQYGEVNDVFIVRSALGISSGCGHVTFSTTEQARAAVQALKGSSECAEPGMTLGVLLVEEGPSSSSTAATPAPAAPGFSSDDASAAAGSSSSAAVSPSAQGTAAQPVTKCGKAVFFTKVPPTVTSQQLIQLFTACGEVAHLELFIPWPGAKISRGCGLVEFTSSSAAAAAVHSMHQQFTWPHSHSALVVEWVDRSRQSTSNKSNKARAAAPSAPNSGSNIIPTGSPSLSAAGTSLPADQYGNQAAAHSAFNWRPAHAFHQQQQPAFAGGAAMVPQQMLPMQQTVAGRGSHSCPLPQLPPGWHVIGTAQQLPAAGGMGPRAGITGAGWASVPASLSTMAGTRQRQSPAAALLPQQHAGGDGSNALTLQQQMLQQRSGVSTSETGSGGGWLACPVTASLSNVSAGAVSMDLTSLTSLGSAYDTTVLSSSTFSSNANSTNNSTVLQAPAWDKAHAQQAPAAAGPMLDLSSCDLSSGSNVKSSQFSEPMLAVSTGMGSNDTILQQLLQQNVMLLQNMTTGEEEVSGSNLLMPTSGAQHNMVATSAAAVSGGLTGASYMGPMSPAQQLPTSQVMYTASMLPQHQHQQQRQQQMMWLQAGQAQPVPQPPPQMQQQQHQDNSGAVVALPLTQRQLAAMSGVLPEVPRLTGAQAWISSAATGVLQLCLSGSYAQLQAGHAAVAMLLSKAGVDEPLAPAVVHASN